MRGHDQVAGLLHSVAKRWTVYEAFAMGQHERLGASSLVQVLDPGVVRIILDLT